MTLDSHVSPRRSTTAVEGRPKGGEFRETLRREFRRARIRELMAAIEYRTFGAFDPGDANLNLARRGIIKPEGTGRLAT